LTTQSVYNSFLAAPEAYKQFFHGHTFTGNPLACAAALASLKLFDEENVLDRTADLETAHRTRMAEFMAHPRVSRVRVMGTILAFDVTSDDSGYTSAVGPALKSWFSEHGLLIRPLGNVVYLLPPYCVSKSQLERAYSGMLSALDSL
ncbi:MAG: aminotransferase class III-fold pyridoxal phosphate-dependent enzyme, partial [Gammaproteobacteria bacterium]